MLILGVCLRVFTCACAQAIRDGVIEASINHEKGFVQSKETMDIYGTREPQLAFHQRISFCLDIHNMSVKVTTSPSHTLCCYCGSQGGTGRLTTEGLLVQILLHPSFSLCTWAGH